MEKGMKKKSFIKILVLLAVIVAVPIAIYILSANETYRSFLVPKILNNFSEKTIKTESLKKANVVYEESDEYEKYNVMSFPTLILMEYKHGNKFEEADRRTGFQTVEQLDDFLRHSSVERRVTGIQ